MDEDSDITKAEAIKDEGNELFKGGRFADAVAQYNDAIELNPEVCTSLHMPAKGCYTSSEARSWLQVPAYYTNRAFCHLKVLQWQC